jgi:broad specificity phosphatase PhoE
VSGHDVVLVRHGETEWSRSGRHTGTTDLELTPAGRAAAERLGPVLADWSFSLALTSPLRRARDTAALAGFGSAEVEPDLVEWTYGDYEGLTTPQIRESVPGWTVWTHPSPGGESAAEIGGRVDRVISRVREVDGPVLLVAHGHVLRVLVARWLGMPSREGRSFVLDPATVSVLGWERETPAVRRWNAPVT